MWARACVRKVAGGVNADASAAYPDLQNGAGEDAYGAAKLQAAPPGVIRGHSAHPVPVSAVQSCPSAPYWLVRR